MPKRQISSPQTDRRTDAYKSVVRVLSVGVDWLTVTQRPGPEADLLRAAALGIADTEIQAGMYGRHWGANGYEGFSVGHLEYGERQLDVICRVHGSPAHAHWQRLFELSRNCSRIDCEVTVRTDEDPAFTVRRHLRELQRYSKKHNLRPQVTYRVDHRGGMTVYSGHPTSAIRLRIYDKQRESMHKQWEGAVRYEAQFNGKKGLWMAAALSGSVAPALTIVSTVLGLGAARGCLVRRLLERIKNGTDVSTPRPWPLSPTDVERTLKWLQVSVRPAVQRVVECKGQEFVADILGF